MTILKKDNSEKGQFCKKKIYEMAILKRGNLKEDNSFKELSENDGSVKDESEKGRFWKVNF